MTAGAPVAIFGRAMDSTGLHEGWNTTRIPLFRLVPAALLLAGSIALARADQPFNFLDWVNLAFHEAGHLFMSPFGQTLYVLGGTLLQVAVPAVLSGYFLVKQRSPFGAALCAWWLGENFLNVSVYMADARAMQLPLVGGGEHDWTQLFYQFGLLGEESVSRVSGATHHLGVLVMLAAVAWVVFPWNPLDAAADADLVLPATASESPAAPSAGE